MARTRGSISSAGSLKARSPGKIGESAAQDVRAAIMRQANPIEILCNVANGRAVRLQTGERLQPTLDHVLFAARLLLNKVLPDASPVDAALEAGQAVTVNISIGPPAPRLVNGTAEATDE
jgi:hypothetical protein